MRPAISYLSVFLIAASIAFARDAREQQRIDYLIQSILSLKGAVFIRNGSDYDAKAAADHLQMKLSYAGARIRTAEQFIQYCATESSMTHRKYTIRFADGSTVESASYLRSKLREFDEKNH